MKSMYIAITAFVFVLLTSCRGERWDDELTLPKQSFTGSQLRLDGYYYRSTSSNYETIFLYRNGVVLYGAYTPFAEIESQEENYANGTFYNSVKDDKTSWGRFIIAGNEIKREFWQPSNGGALQTFTHSGTVVNDTTFRISSSWRSCKPKRKKDLDEVWRFKAFSPKPDSTNQFTN